MTQCDQWDILRCATSQLHIDFKSDLFRPSVARQLTPSMCLHAWWSRPHRTPNLLSLLLLFTLIGCGGVSARAESPRSMLDEYQIKAAAFYNVIAFTNWPRDAFPETESPLVIGIVGHGPVADWIGRLVAGETWHGRRIVVDHFPSLDAIKPCHVLYLAESERTHWNDIRARCENRPTLAVSDVDNFAAKGGNVQLAIQQNKLRIFVNLATTRATGIQLSSNLLHLATIVGPTPAPESSPHSGLRFSPLADLQFCLASID